MGAELRSRYERYVADYTRYARMRGFTSEINDWPYVRRSFLECWAEPGFHRFWQVWNPGISYFVYRLYLKLGGRRRWAWPTMAAFVINGLIHTVVMTPFLLRWSWTLVVAFTFFGTLTVASRYLAPWLRQDAWPWPLNVLCNAGLVAAGMDLGFRVNDLLL